jgi:tetratricopeptide (TPR) repeat protein
MAFGLGFNKAKSLSAAEKYVMQGKVPAAIQEYQKILEQEPRDLVVLNTVGDLLLRINKTAEALTYFYKLGEAYVEDGFVRNGIAVYKKINRSDPAAIEAVCRLADLYTVQGQLSDARGYLNQAVEHYSKQGETTKCVELFEKLLLMDPENAAAKQRLATVYEQAGRKDEAAGMFFSAAEGFADRANPGEAEKTLKKARDLGFASADVTVLQARIYIDAGRGPEAVALLAGIPDMESNRGAQNLLFHAYMSAGDLASAGQVAATIFQKFEDFAGVEQVATTLIERGEIPQALSLYESVAEAAIAQRLTQPLAEGLRNVLAQNRDCEPARRLQRRIYQATGETGEFTDASEQLADVLSRRGEYGEARDIYAELARMEPANPMHRQRMQQMDQRAGRPAGEADAPALSLDLETAPPTSSAKRFSTGAAALDPQSQSIVDSALAEADQQATFLQTDDAIATLRTAIGQLPGNIILNQKLVEICEQAQRWPEAMAACEALAEAFVMAGDGENATRYSELQARYRATAEGGAPAAEFAVPPQEFAMPEPSSLDSPAAETSGSSGVAEFAVPMAMPMGIAEMEIPASAPQDTITLPPELTSEAPSSSPTGTHEVDLSGEWETSTGEEPAPEGPSDADRLAEEIAGHLRAGMISEASLALETMRALAAEDPRLGDLESQVQQAVLTGSLPELAPEPGAQAGAITDFGGSQMPPELPVETSVSPLDWPTETAAVVPPEVPSVPETLSVPLVHEEEFSLDLESAAAPASDDFVLELEEPPALPPPRPVASAPPPAPPMSMADLLGTVEDSLADITPPAAKPPAPHAPAPTPAPEPRKTPARAAAPSKGGLADVFADFKQEMEQDAAVDADVENHYNMGMSFKEMGLYDEAIGEFQKAFHGAENSPSHPNFIPVCSLLAHCFLEKNLPELAVKWLQNGLKAPGLDREGEMALRYEIGSAQEAAGQKTAAMESFMLVYALNIDYRDVADRIRSLKGN